MKLQGEYTYIPNPELERLYTQGWYIGTINRAMWGENSIRVFTPLRGVTTRLNVDGINVIVRNGEVVEQVTGTDMPIPPDGYIIHLGGTEVRFKDRLKWAQSSITVTFMMCVTVHIPTCGRRALFGELLVLVHAS